MLMKLPGLFTVKKHFGNPDAGEFFLNELVTALTILSGISLFQKKGTNRGV
jgi:hypothetical protein